MDRVSDILNDPSFPIHTVATMCHEAIHRKGCELEAMFLFQVLIIHAVARDMIKDEAMIYPRHHVQMMLRPHALDIAFSPLLQNVSALSIDVLTLVCIKTIQEAHAYPNMKENIVSSLNTLLSDLGNFRAVRETMLSVSD